MVTTETRKTHDKCFLIFRGYLFINAALMYSIVFFHRNCPSVVSEDMAKDYDVEKKKLGIFSSVFFYPYAVMQVFAGMLSDIFDPAVLIAISQIISAIGALICGLSNGIPVGCVGRLLVGLGCGPTYVPICKLITYWFPMKYYSTMMGALLAFGGIGGILGQLPLAAFADKFGWRTAFYGIGGIGFILSVLLIIFCRGKPEDRGYMGVNHIVESKDISCKERMIQLGQNFLKVIKNYYFWICSAYVFFKDGPFSDISGLWAGSYLADVCDYKKIRKGVTLIGFSAGMIIGAIIYPRLSELLKTRKWICMGSEVLAGIVLIIFSIFGKLPFGVIFFLFVIIGITMNAVTCLIFVLVKDYYETTLVGSSIGLTNFFAFFGTAIFQTISSEIIPKSGHKVVDDKDIYTEEGYRKGLWIFCAVSSFVSALVISFTKDTMGEKEEKEEEKKKESQPSNNEQNKGETELKTCNQQVEPNKENEEKDVIHLQSERSENEMLHGIS